MLDSKLIVHIVNEYESIMYDSWQQHFKCKKIWMDHARLLSVLVQWPSILSVYGYSTAKMVA